MSSLACSDALTTKRRLLGIHPYWEGAQEALEQLKRDVEGDGT